MGEAPDVLAPTSLGPVRLRNREVEAATFEAVQPRQPVHAYHLLTHPLPVVDEELTAVQTVSG
ncbi:MAG TPA: hypothetical protein VFR87_14615 [Nocardioidaceae bacterium]|nr:hypothetical protein [Nocardioidaceae bacterium]